MVVQIADRTPEKVWRAKNAARRNALDLLRRRYREAQVLSLDEGLADSNSGPLLESGLEEQELRRVVLEEVNALEEPDREIVLRKYYLGSPPRRLRGG